MPALTFMKVSTAPFAMSSNVVPSKMRFSIIKQNRFRILICEGYRYSRYMVVYNKEYWRCTDRTCKGKLHMSGGRIVFIKKNGHCHGPDHKGVSADQAVFIMRKRAYNEETPFHQIYKETVKEFEETGHGPMRDLLSYEECQWKVLNQMPGKDGQPGHYDGSGGTGSQPSLADAVMLDDGNSAVQLPVDHPGRNDAVNEDDVLEVHSADEQKPEVCELEVIDCTDVADDSHLSSTKGSSANKTTHPLNEMLPASRSSLARSASAPYNHSSVHSAVRRPATTITTQGGHQQGSYSPGLQIHSTYSLQRAANQTNASAKQQEGLQGIVGNPVSDIEVGVHVMNSIPEAPSQHSGQRATNPSRETYGHPAPSSRSTLQVNSDMSQVSGAQRSELNHHTAQSGSPGSTSNRATPNTGHHVVRHRGVALKNARSRSSAVRTHIFERPSTSTSFAELAAHSPGNLDAPDQMYPELQMRLARKEHRLRLQYMKERHDADMVLVHLQQELVREQLRELRQLRGGITS